MQRAGNQMMEKLNFPFGKVKVKVYLRRKVQVISMFVLYDADLLRIKLLSLVFSSDLIYIKIQMLSRKTEMYLNCDFSQLYLISSEFSALESEC